MLSSEEKRHIIDQFARYVIEGNKKGLAGLLEKEGEYEIHSFEFKIMVCKRAEYVSELLCRRLNYLRYNDVLKYEIIQQDSNDGGDWLLLMNDGLFPYIAYIEEDDTAAALAFEFNDHHITSIRFCYSYPGCLRQSFLERFEKEVNEKLIQLGHINYGLAVEAVFMRKYGDIPMQDFLNRIEYIFWNHFINTSFDFKEKVDRAHINTAGIPLDDDEFFSEHNPNGPEWDEDDEEDNWWSDEDPPF
jgi:hypothetical protein